MRASWLRWTISPRSTWHCVNSTSPCSVPMSAPISCAPLSLPHRFLNAGSGSPSSKRRASRSRGAPIAHRRIRTTWMICWTTTSERPKAPWMQIPRSRPGKNGVSRLYGRPASRPMSTWPSSNPPRTPALTTGSPSARSNSTNSCSSPSSWLPTTARHSRTRPSTPA